MRYLARVTSKGQITIPAHVRRALGICERDRVAFTIEDGQARIEKAKSVTEETAGAFKKYWDGTPMTGKELNDMAEAAWEDEAVERYERSTRR